MTSENKGYTLALENGRLHQKQEKIFLKPMVLYIPQQAVEAVNDLLSKLPDDREEGEFLLFSLPTTFEWWRPLMTC